MKSKIMLISATNQTDLNEDSVKADSSSTKTAAAAAASGATGAASSSFQSDLKANISSDLDHNSMQSPSTPKSIHQQQQQQQQHQHHPSHQFTGSRMSSSKMSNMIYPSSMMSPNTPTSSSSSLCNILTAPIMSTMIPASSLDNQFGQMSLNSTGSTSAPGNSLVAVSSPYLTSQPYGTPIYYPKQNLSGSSLAQSTDPSSMYQTATYTPQTPATTYSSGFGASSYCYSTAPGANSLSYTPTMNVASLSSSSTSSISSTNSALPNVASSAAAPPAPASLYAGQHHQQQQQQAPTTSYLQSASTCPYHYQMAPAQPTQQYHPYSYLNYNCATTAACLNNNTTTNTNNNNSSSSNNSLYSTSNNTNTHSSSTTLCSCYLNASSNNTYSLNVESRPTFVHSNCSYLSVNNYLDKRLFA